MRESHLILPAIFLIFIVDWGLDYIEIDVRVSKDSVYYILYDETVDRTTNGTGEISALTAAEIDTLDAGSWD